MEIYVREMKNVDVRYRIEKMDDEVLELKLEKWDDGKGWNYNFPAGWVDADTQRHLYADLSSVKRGGNYYLISNSKNVCIDFCYRLVINYWNNTSQIAMEATNNLCIYDENYNEVWNLFDFLDREEICTGIRQTGENTFYFSTFSCIGYEINVDELKVVKTVFAR